MGDLHTSAELLLVYIYTYLTLLCEHKRACNTRNEMHLHFYGNPLYIYFIAAEHEMKMVRKPDTYAIAQLNPNFLTFVSVKARRRIVRII